MVRDDAGYVLVVREGIRRNRVVAAEVADFPRGGDGDAVEERDIRNDVAHFDDSVLTQRGNERRENGFAIEGPASAKRWIAAAANDQIVAVAPKFRGNLPVQPFAGRDGRRGKELAI